jgi:hypothetical protein
LSDFFSQDAYRTFKARCSWNPKLEIGLSGKLAAVDTDGLGLPLALDDMCVFLRISEEKIPLLPEGILVPAGRNLLKFL